MVGCFALSSNAMKTSIIELYSHMYDAQKASTYAKINKLKVYFKTRFTRNLQLKTTSANLYVFTNHISKFIHIQIDMNL